MYNKNDTFSPGAVCCQNLCFNMLDEGFHIVSAIIGYMTSLSLQSKERLNYTLQSMHSLLEYRWRQISRPPTKISLPYSSHSYSDIS